MLGIGKILGGTCSIMKNKSVLIILAIVILYYLYKRGYLGFKSKSKGKVTNKCDILKEKKNEETVDKEKESTKEKDDVIGQMVDDIHRKEIDN